MKTTDYLIKEGYELSFKGFGYLSYILDNYKSYSSLNIKNIYDEIAKKFDTTYTRIERDIRHLIKKKNNQTTVKKEIADLVYRLNKE